MLAVCDCLDNFGFNSLPLFLEWYNACRKSTHSDLLPNCALQNVNPGMLGLWNCFRYPIRHRCWHSIVKTDQFAKQERKQEQLNVFVFISLSHLAHFWILNCMLIIDWTSADQLDINCTLETLMTSSEWAVTIIRLVLRAHIVVFCFSWSEST